jgi:hypothetical protein
VIDLAQGVYERRRTDTWEVLARLKERHAQQQHPKVKQDMQILVQALEDSLLGGEVSQRLLLPYFNVPQIAFNGIRVLLNPNVVEARRAAAVVRLKKYAGFVPGTKPVTELAKERTTDRCEMPGLIGPYRVELRKDLAKADSFESGIADLMREHGMKDWEQAHQVQRLKNIDDD